MFYLLYLYYADVAHDSVPTREETGYDLGIEYNF